MAIVDAKYRFIYVDVGSEGRASDGGVWARSKFGANLRADHNPLQVPGAQNMAGAQDAMPYYLVGDDAFPLGPNLLKPYPGSSLPAKKTIFNYRLSRARRTVENGFGILSSRFRIFLRPIEINPDSAEDIVWAACILHNYLQVHAPADYMRGTDVDMETPEGDVIPGIWRAQDLGMRPLPTDPQRNATSYAKKVRDSLADYFLTPEGELPWQYEKVWKQWISHFLHIISFGWLPDIYKCSPHWVISAQDVSQDLV